MYVSVQLRKINLFVCLFQESDDIPLDSYCRIEHVVSGKWLHAFTGMRCLLYL